eukprot:gene13892-16418_t
MGRTVPEEARAQQGGGESDEQYGGEVTPTAGTASEGQLQKERDHSSGEASESEEQQAGE